MLKTITKTMAIASLLTIGSTAFAQPNSDSQPVSPPSVGQQSAGGYGTTNMWAYVAANGTHTAKTGGLSLASTAKLSGSGQYEVIFRRAVHNNCFFGGTSSRLADGTLTPGFVTAVRRSGNTKGVFVQTFNEAGLLEDRPFMVYAYCYR